MPLRTVSSAAQRAPIFAALVGSFCLLVTIATEISGVINPRLLYVCLLFAICATPVLYGRKLNDRYALYTIFFIVYFVSFGMLDVINLVWPQGHGGVASVVTSAEVLILAGGISFIGGYQLVAGRKKERASSQFFVEEWPPTSLLVVGLLLWAFGTLATWYWNIYLTVRAGEINFSSDGVTTALMIGRYVQPLGLLMIAYAYTTSKSKTLLLLTCGVVSVQILLGFVSDTKGGAMLGGILVIATSFLVLGKVPKGWVILGMLFIFFAFPVFQAHRVVVVDEQGFSNADSVSNFGSALRLSLQDRKRVMSDHAESFFERSSVKSSVEMIVDRTGGDVPFQHGHTLAPLLFSFIPRIIWQGKSDVQAGQLLNTEFHVTGDSVTYISPSHLGELFWNFGWIGAIAGMLLLGALLGSINRACDLSAHTSVTRLLILGITMYELCVRFEASIATEYAVWIRSVAGILVMHKMFARPILTMKESDDVGAMPERVSVHVRSDAAEQHPNLMR